MTNSAAAARSVHLNSHTIADGGTHGRVRPRFHSRTGYCWITIFLLSANGPASSV